jgi:hypothetical protein
VSDFEPLTVKPSEIRVGDRLTHKGVDYEVTDEPLIGKYAVWRIGVRRLGSEDIGLDYNANVRVHRRSE